MRNYESTGRRPAAIEVVGQEPIRRTSTFFSVAQTAQLLGMSEMTLYRAISAGEFPAVRIRGRLIIPARAIDEMVDAALAGGRSVDAVDWVATAAGVRS